MALSRSFLEDVGGSREKWRRASWPLIRVDQLFSSLHLLPFIELWKPHTYVIMIHCADPTAICFRISLNIHHTQQVAHLHTILLKVQLLHAFYLWAERVHSSSREIWIARFWKNPWPDSEKKISEHWMCKVRNQTLWNGCMIFWWLMHSASRLWFVSYKGSSSNSWNRNWNASTRTW